ncbi:MAG TPA: TGS domain-containing protein, partial [Syntrophales bacterium]
MMSEINITWPDNSRGTFPGGTTIKDAIGSWKPDVLISTVAAKVNGSPLDLGFRLEKDAVVEPIDVATKEGLGILRHSTSHVMAQAVQDTFPGAKVSIGPSIEEGFYYDFEYETTFTPEDLQKIEQRMQEITATDSTFSRREISREEAVALFKEKRESYKVELINDLPPDVKTVSLYSQGGYVDLCRGPHLPSTQMIKAFRLLKVAGAYWRG